MCRIIMIFFAGAVLTMNASAQNATDSFTISGDVLTSVTLNMNDLKALPSTQFDSMIVFGHDMQRKNTIRNIKGVLLRNILSRVQFNAENPKVLSAYAIECFGIDGYMVLFSWNEIFNSETGDHTMIVVEKNGSDYENQTDRIALITPTDRATGRRYVKWLSKIVIQRMK